MEEIKTDLITDLQLERSTENLDLLATGESRYLKDLRVNFSNVLKPGLLTEKEIALLGVAISANAKNPLLQRFFARKAEALDATPAEIAEAVACASLLASNNIFYRFRHFVKKEKYNELRAGLKMNIMLRPVLGKELFELISLAVSAVNGCEMCVASHEQSLMELGTSEERVFEAVRLASMVTSMDRVVH